MPQIDPIQAAIDDLSAQGIHSIWTLWIGIGPEFFLLRQDEQGQWLAADTQDRLGKPSYDLKAIHRNHAFRDDMRQTLTQLGFRLQQIDHEDACGQSMPARLPRDLSATLDALAQDAALMAALGQDFCHQFLAIKRQEWRSFSELVSDWELGHYADHF